MKNEEGFSVEVESRFDGWWRYNVTILCGCFDAQGNRVGFASAERIVAPVGGDLPEDIAAKAQRRIGIRSVACDRIVMYVYIVPHTLPETREIGDVSPFDVRVRIGYGGAPAERYAVQDQSVVGRIARNQAPQRRDAVQAMILCKSRQAAVGERGRLS